MLNNNSLWLVSVFSAYLGVCFLYGSVFDLYIFY